MRKIVPDGFREWWKSDKANECKRELTWSMVIAMGLVLALIGGYFIFNH